MKKIDRKLSITKDEYERLKQYNEYLNLYGHLPLSYLSLTKEDKRIMLKRYEEILKELDNLIDELNIKIDFYKSNNKDKKVIKYSKKCNKYLDIKSIFDTVKELENTAIIDSILLEQYNYDDVIFASKEISFYSNKLKEEDKIRVDSIYSKLKDLSLENINKTKECNRIESQTKDLEEAVSILQEENSLIKKSKLRDINIELGRLYRMRNYLTYLCDKNHLEVETLEKVLSHTLRHDISIFKK